MYAGGMANVNVVLKLLQAIMRQAEVMGPPRGPVVIEFAEPALSVAASLDVDPGPSDLAQLTDEPDRGAERIIREHCGLIEHHLTSAQGHAPDVVRRAIVDVRRVLDSEVRRCP